MSKYLNILQKIQSLSANQPVKLVAVSKVQTLDSIRAVYDAGCRNFGENYVDELLDKHHQLPSDIRWHFIGHLQSNKIKKLLGVPNLEFVQSVDRKSLAEKLNGELKKQSRMLKVLVQIKTSQQESKNGADPKEVIELIRYINDECGCLNFRGLMTIGKEGDLSAFREMVEFRDRIVAQSWNKLSKEEFALSMGMSGDYEAAIKEGSTEVRVGSLVFGPRPAKIQPN